MAHTKEKLKKFYGDTVSSDFVDYKWFTEFRRIRIGMSDAPRSERTVEIETEEMINKIYNVVLVNRKEKVESVKMINISNE